MEDFSSIGQLVTLDLVDSSKELALVDVEALVATDVLLSLKHLMIHLALCSLRSY